MRVVDDHAVLNVLVVIIISERGGVQTDCGQA